MVNPHAQARIPAALWELALETVRQRVQVCDGLETRADAGNPDRVARLIAECEPEMLIMAGGDGTLREVVQGIMLVDPGRRPALAIIPLGTANNVARAFGLASCRAGRAAMELAVETALGSTTRRIDLGRVASDYFVGSFALGMDADILVTRNRLRRRFQLGPRLGGYPLYLASCALNLLRRHGGRARLLLNGAPVAHVVYNLLVTNTPLYAGEFRFGAALTCDDGRLDLHVFEGPLDYVRQFVAAWRRHLRFTSGRAVDAPGGLRRVEQLQITLDGPTPSQLDGEQQGAAAAYVVQVVPRALDLHVPGDRGGAQPGGG